MGQPTEQEKTGKLLKTIKQAIISLLFATIFIYLFNIAGVNFNMHIPINIWTITIVAFLRVPGVIIVLVGLGLS